MRQGYRPARTVDLARRRGPVISVAAGSVSYAGSLLRSMASWA